MSAETKKQALEKLHGHAQQDRLPRPAGATTRPSRCGAATSRATSSAPPRFESRRQLAKIGKPVDRGEWEMTPPTVNAYYDPQMNDINFPAGVLQPPLFDPKMDDAPNYGNTGGTIGHELTHGFDDEGRQFDAQGNLSDWWTAAGRQGVRPARAPAWPTSTRSTRSSTTSRSTASSPSARTSPTSAARSSPTWPGRSETDEPEARAASTASRPSSASSSASPSGPAATTARRARRAQRASPTRTRRHEYRINGVVVNMPEFAAAFTCKAGQPMVKEPAKVCKVW